MRICLIHNLFEPFAKGGAEKVVKILAQGLSTQGYQLCLITTQPSWARYPVEKGQAGLKIYYLPAFYYQLAKMPKFLRIFWHFFDLFNLKKFWQVRKILQKEKVEIVITHNLKGLGYLIPRALKSLKIKHLHYLHDLQLLHPSGLMLVGKEKQLESWPAKIYQFFCRQLFSSVKIVISPTNWLLKMHTEKKFFSQAKFLVLANPTIASPSLNIKKKTGQIFRWLFIGQIEAHKGIFFLIKTFIKFRQQPGCQVCKLIIIGRGLKLAQAKRLARSEKDIVFLGWQNRLVIERLMKLADCLILPSLCYENSPTVINQAWQAGLPILAARLGGVEELLAKQTGILFAGGDSQDLLEKMNWAITHQEELKRIVQNGFNQLKNLTFNEHLAKLKKFLR